jgi:hypothetical protein
MLVKSQISIVHFKNNNDGYDVTYYLNGDLNTLTYIHIFTPDYISTQLQMKEYVLEELNKDKSKMRYEVNFDNYISVIDTYNGDKEILHIEYDEEMEYVMQDIEKLFKYLNKQ